MAVADHRSDGKAEPRNGAAFAFVQELAVGLSNKQIELPSFPDVALRVRRVLSNEEVSTQDVVRIVGSEPALAALIMRMGNSAALGHVGKPIADLRLAITRIGFNLVRGASVTFAMAQLRRSAELKPIQATLQAHWERSASVASFCHFIAKRFTSVNVDMALLAGLMHGVGKLYILTRAVRHPTLFSNQAVFNEIERDWHASIATALLEHWLMPAEIVAAVRDHEDLEREVEGPPDLTDVLTVAGLLTTFRVYPDSLELNMQGVKAAERMRLDRKSLELLIEDSGKDVALLRQTLGL